MSDLGEARWGVTATQKCMHHPAWFSSTHYVSFKQRTLSCSCSLNLVLSLFPPLHTHTHTHTHSNFFFKEKKDTQLHTNIWRVMSGKNNQRNRAYSLCLCTMHACSVAQLCPTPQQKRFFFFLKSNSRDFSDGPLIKRLHLPMKGCRINPWSGNPTCLKAKNPKHKKKKQFTYKRA